MKHNSGILTDVFERITDAFVALDINWCYTYMNKKAGEIFQRNPVDMIGKNFWGELPESIDHPFYKAFHAAMENQQPMQVQQYYALYDRWFDNHIYPSPDGLSVFFRDITEQKKSDEKILLSEVRLLKVQHIGKFGYWHQDINSDTVWASKEAMLIYGFGNEEGELQRATIASCIIYVDKVKEATVNLVEHGKEYNIDIRINPADGSPMKYISTLADLEKNEKGEPVRIVGTLQDITERKLAEENFKSSEIRYRRLFQAAKDGILILNADTGLIEDVNPYLCEMLRYTREEVLGKELWEIGLYKDIAANKEAFLELKKTKYEKHDNLPLLTKEGQPIWVEFVSNVYEESSRMVIQCNIRNITDRKKAADEIEHSTKQLRELTAHLQTILEEERKRIAREIHDELGQQLTAIKMDLVWMDKKIPEDIKVAEAIIPVKSKLKNLISLVDGSNESVRKILNELRHGILEDNGLLEALEWQGNQFTEVAGIPVKFSTKEVSLVLSEEIANCLFRLYQESLTNIARHAQATKVITSVKIKKENIILIVEDDGKGFDVNALQNKKSFGILGMKERVFSLHGKFELLSSKGKGTTIEISLPLRESVNLKQTL